MIDQKERRAERLPPVVEPDSARTSLPSLTGSQPPTSLTRPQHLLELACRILHARQGGIGFLSSDGELVEHLTYGLPDEVTAQLWHSPRTAEVIRFVLQQSMPTNLRDFSESFPSLGPPGLPAAGPFLGLPLVCHGRCRGALYLARAPGEPAFSPQDEDILQPIHAWLEQGNVFEESRLQGQLRLLTHVAQAAAGSLELAPILTVALRELDRHLPLHVSVVWLLEDSQRENKRPSRGGLPASLADDPVPISKTSHIKIADVRSVPHERGKQLGLRAGLRLEVGATPFASCLESGEAVYIDFARPEEQNCALSADLAARGASSSFAVALRTGNQSVGVLQSVCVRTNGFTNEQVQLLYLVADLLGPAISNCQLFGRLRRAYDELRHTQGQLIQAEKMRALGELAGGMAHDFNNSLCGVLGFLELVLPDPTLSAPARNYLESARTCTLDAAQTVRRVQSFARWERNELSVQLLDLNQLVHQTIELTRHKWESLTHARGIPITVETVTEAKSMVTGSAAELREVLTNLVFNAVDAMPQGGTLTVRTWSTDTDVFFSVHDTGVGMSEAVRQRLFEPFFTTKGERGNGLGLSVTFGIVQRYHGEITVESRVGKGSTFTVKLPVVADKQVVAADPAKPGPAAAAEVQPSSTNAQAARQTPKSLRILVVEDEESIRRFLDLGLTQLGHRPRLTADAKEGLKAFKEEHFDVVVTDLGLPGISGEEVARNVARQSPGLPVILLTGWSNQLKEEPMPLEGVTCVLGKPVTLSTLAKTLTSICSA